MPLKLHLGCGTKYLPGYVNCDVSSRVKADHHFDLDHPPYPFDAGCADELYLNQVLEHLDNIPIVMEEFHRLLVPGGVLRIDVPYAKSDWALQDPTHKHFFTERSMDYFCANSPYSFYSTARFELVEARLYGNNSSLLHRLRNALPLKGVLRYFLYNLYDGVYFELRKAH